MQHVVAHVCGFCGPQNPSPQGGWGYTFHSATGELIHEESGLVTEGQITNNVAEYVAASKAVLAYAKTDRDAPLLVCSSSQLVVQQMKGVWPARRGTYKEVYVALHAFVAQCVFPITWKWVPLTQNERAANLAKIALTQEVWVPPAKG